MEYLSIFVCNSCFLTFCSFAVLQAIPQTEESQCISYVLSLQLMHTWAVTFEGVQEKGEHHIIALPMHSLSRYRDCMGGGGSRSMPARHTLHANIFPGHTVAVLAFTVCPKRQVLNVRRVSTHDILHWPFSCPSVHKEPTPKKALSFMHIATIMECFQYIGPSTILLVIMTGFCR